MPLKAMWSAFALDLDAVEAAGSTADLRGALHSMLERLGASVLMTATRGMGAGAPFTLYVDAALATSSWNQRPRELARSILAAGASQGQPVRLASLGAAGEDLRQALAKVQAPDAFLVPGLRRRARSVSLLAGAALLLDGRATLISTRILIETVVAKRENLQGRGRRDAELLTQRQRACLDAALRGANSIQIGAELNLAPRTVDAYIAAAAQRLGACNRVAAVGMAVQLGLIGSY